MVFVTGPPCEKSLNRVEGHIEIECDRELVLLLGPDLTLSQLE